MKADNVESDPWSSAIIENGEAGDHSGVSKADGNGNTYVSNENSQVEDAIEASETIPQSGGYTFEAFMKRFWNLFPKKDAGNYSDVKSMVSFFEEEFCGF